MVIVPGSRLLFELRRRGCKCFTKGGGVGFGELEGVSLGMGVDKAGVSD